MVLNRTGFTRYDCPACDSSCSVKVITETGRLKTKITIHRCTQCNYLHEYEILIEDKKNRPF